MKKVMTYSKLAMKFAKGICTLKKKEYDLQFVYEPEDNLWYIDMPWPGDRYKYGIADFTREIWICPVSLTVLGHYPKYIYIKKV